MFQFLKITLIIFNQDTTVLPDAFIIFLFI